MFTMYKKILTAVNEHLNSEIAAKYALNLARATEAKLYISFIAEPSLSPQDIGRAEEAVKRLFIEAGEAGIEVEAVTGAGEPVRKLGELVRREGVDIVFASARRADTERRFYAGTVARRLSMSLPCSVAIVRVVHIGRIHPKEILVPLKAKVDHVEERAYFTAKLAQAFGSNVVVFHAPQPVSKFFHGEIHLTPLEWEKALPKDVAHFMEHIHRYKVTHTGKFVPGRTGRAIAIEAFSKRHDLIIMGASRRSLLSSLFKGNPVEELLRHTPCDLIILKPK